MGCLFCDIYGRNVINNNPEDIVLDSNDDFYVKPALGHFIEGYALLISKEHKTSFSLLHLDDKDLAFIKRVEKRLMSIYNKPIAFFEHGDCQGGSGAGSCYHHAHMHMIPLDFDIHDILSDNFDYKEMSGVTNIKEVVDDNNSYIYYKSVKDNHYMYFVDTDLPSQFIRRIIASKINMHDVWDWKKNYFREKIENFVRKYK